MGACVFLERTRVYRFCFFLQADDKKKKRYMSASDLQVCVGEAKEKGWNAGIMFWQWSDVSVRKLGRSV